MHDTLAPHPQKLASPGNDDDGHQLSLNSSLAGRKLVHAIEALDPLRRLILGWQFGLEGPVVDVTTVAGWLSLPVASVDRLIGEAARGACVGASVVDLDLDPERVACRGRRVKGIRANRVSPSAINRYLTCPKQYRVYDLERAAPRPEPSPILARANAVHHALERFFGLPAEDRQPENLERALRSVWPEHRRGAFRSLDEEIEHGQAAVEMLRLFGQAFDLHAVPLAREQWLTAELPSGVQVFGKVDRIDALRGGGLEVIDYKTGARPLESGDLKHEPATWRTSPQQKPRTRMLCGACG